MSRIFHTCLRLCAIFLMFFVLDIASPSVVFAQPFCWCKQADNTCSQHGARAGETPRQVTNCGTAPAGSTDTVRLTYCNDYCNSRGWRAVHCETSYNNYYCRDNTADDANKCTPNPSAPGANCPTAGESESGSSGGSGSMGDGGEDRTSPTDFGLLNPLGTNDFRSVINRLIRAVLGVVGALFLAMFVFGGVKWMTTTDSKNLGSAKQILVNAVIGMVIISFSYSIVSIIFSLAGQVSRRG